MHAARGVVTSDVVGSHIVEPGGTAFGNDLTGVASIGLSLPLDDGTPPVTLPLCTASLITDHHILTAAHCLDGFLDSTDDGEIKPPDGKVDDLFLETPLEARLEAYREAMLLTQEGRRGDAVGMPLESPIRPNVPNLETITWEKVIWSMPRAIADVLSEPDTF